MSSREVFDPALELPKSQSRITGRDPVYTGEPYENGSIRYDLGGQPFWLRAGLWDIRRQKREAVGQLLVVPIDVSLQSTTVGFVDPLGQELAQGAVLAHTSPAGTVQLTYGMPDWAAFSLTRDIYGSTLGVTKTNPNYTFYTSRPIVDDGKLLLPAPEGSNPVTISTKYFDPQIRQKLFLPVTRT